MTRHDVQFTIPQRPPEKADVEFQIKQGGEVLGTLAVSHGSIVWFPKGTTYGCKIGWAQFDRLMQERAIR